MSKKKEKDFEFYPAALTIAGSDSGGGAGIQADLRTFSAFGVFGCCAVTAVTSQNPAEVRRIDPVPAEGVAAQIDAVTDRIAIRCAKSGMLFSPEIVDAVSDAVVRHKLKLVCDPVMISTSGAPLLREEARSRLIEKILPLASWITPNLPEAELLLGRSISNEREAAAGARELNERFGASILLKGGHADAEEAGDFICRKGKVYRMWTKRLDCPPLAAHGTGCTISAAMAAGFALGLPWKRVLCGAKGFVQGSLAGCVPIGPGLFGMYPPESCGVRKVHFEVWEEA